MEIIHKTSGRIKQLTRQGIIFYCNKVWPKNKLLFIIYMNRIASKRRIYLSILIMASINSKVKQFTLLASNADITQLSIISPSPDISQTDEFESSKIMVTRNVNHLVSMHQLKPIRPGHQLKHRRNFSMEEHTLDSYSKCSNNSTQQYNHKKIAFQGTRVDASIKRKRRKGFKTNVKEIVYSIEQNTQKSKIPSFFCNRSPSFNSNCHKKDIDTTIRELKLALQNVEKGPKHRRIRTNSFQYRFE